MSYFLPSEIKLMFDQFNETSQQILTIHKDYMELIRRSQFQNERKSDEKNSNRNINHYDRKLYDRKLNRNYFERDERKQRFNVINNNLNNRTVDRLQTTREEKNRQRTRPRDTDYSRTYYYTRYTRPQSFSDSRLNQLMNNVFSMIINDDETQDDQTQSPVIIHPTNEEINNSTYSCPFKDMKEKKFDTCPISKELFCDNDIVCQIKSCKHVFLKSNLMKWFETNVRCPVCRYDIRNYRSNT